MRQTYKIVHDRCTVSENTTVERKGRLVHVAAVLIRVCTIIDAVGIGVNELDILHPGPSHVGPVGVCLVTCVAGKSRTKGEKETCSNAFCVKC